MFRTRAQRDALVAMIKVYGTLAMFFAVVIPFIRVTLS